jgi:hypothetical protein
VKDINGRRRAEFSDDDYEYFARLRDELARGPKGMCDALEYAPLDDIEKRIEEAKQRGRVYGTVHGGDIRRIESSPETGRPGKGNGLRLVHNLGE